MDGGNVVAFYKVLAYSLYLDTYTHTQTHTNKQYYYTIPGREIYRAWTNNLSFHETNICFIFFSFIYFVATCWLLLSLFVCAILLFCCFGGGVISLIVLSVCVCVLCLFVCNNTAQTHIYFLYIYIRTCTYYYGI